MINYKRKIVKKIDNKIIDQLYNELLENRYQFMIIEEKQQLWVLTKEKSVFKIDDEDKFIDDANRDIYYHTENTIEEVDLGDRLDVYKEYIKKYENRILKKLYGGKYIFGSVAVRINKNSFITTIRGKKDLLEYTIVSLVDQDTYTVYVKGKKATLNAPLLAHLFENEKVDAIVHINHFFDDTLPYYEYAFPGTIKDSIRDNKKSFNIRHHGVIYLYDKFGNMV